MKQLSFFEEDKKINVLTKPLSKKQKIAQLLAEYHKQAKELSETNLPIETVEKEDLVEYAPLEVKHQLIKQIKELGQYAEYSPQIMVQGAKKHPSPLCESLAMASIRLPKTFYVPNLPENTINSGILSSAQLEDITLAGNAHMKFINNGKYRQGFMIGSGTGFGKGNTIAGIILDNFRQQRKKAVWISKNDKAHMNSIDYWKDVGGNSEDFFDHRKFKPDQEIQMKSGVLVTTYGILRSKFSKDEVDDQTFVEGRVKQIIEWLGSDFDGVIAFDESHIMANAMDLKVDRFVKKGSLVALVGVTLQRLLPKARIIYSSATGASEVQNLVYAERLGLYGHGTSFSDKLDFINEIKSSGVTAMELIARDLKSLGLYTARSLSYEGVEYDTVTHHISKSQKELYDSLAIAWQKVLANINDAISYNKTSKNAKAAAMSSFWSTHQRFFNQIILTIQFPSVAKDIKKHIDNGDSIIIQITSTNEAQTKRALADAKGQDIGQNITMESIDISPKQMLIEYLCNSFPIQQFEEYEDHDGNILQKPVKDEHGNHVINRESLSIRDRLIETIHDELNIPEGPLDLFISTFGAENVAEVTGRTIRLVNKHDPYSGEITKVQEKRTPAHAKKEIKDFNDDKRRILIFSEAGGTGGSFHADKRIANQRRRVHYVYQPGWRADTAVQGFGRSHRSNQVIPPLFKLCATNIKAQKRFLSSIARRLENLGALTKGQRTTGGQGILDNSYNFESDYAKEALQLTYYDILHNHSPIRMKELESMMGLQIMHKEDGVVQINKELIQDIKKFLNRILSLEIDIMNKVFSAFESKMNGLINQARLSGTYEQGITHIQAEETKLIEEIPIFRHEETKAEAILTTLQLRVKVNKKTWGNIQKLAEKTAFIGYFTQINSGKIYACFFAYSSTSAEGSTSEYYNRIGVKGEAVFEDEEFLENHKPVPDTYSAKYIWDLQYQETPDSTIEMHSLIKGLLLPIWNKIPGENVVNRYIDNDGIMHLGRFISQNHLAHVRSLFNLNNHLSITEIVKKLNHNFIIEMNNGMKLRSTSIQSIPSIEFENVDASLIKQMQELGFFIRIKNKLMDIKNAHLPKHLIPEKLPILMKLLNIQVIKYYPKS